MTIETIEGISDDVVLKNIGSLTDLSGDLKCPKG
jgi:hypothetical protein